MTLTRGLFSNRAEQLVHCSTFKRLAANFLLSCLFVLKTQTSTTTTGEHTHTHTHTHTHAHTHTRTHTFYEIHEMLRNMALWQPCAPEPQAHQNPPEN